MSAPDKAIPSKLLNRAQCIIVVPGMKKAALGIGGTYGRGIGVLQPARASREAASDFNWALSRPTSSCWS